MTKQHRNENIVYLTIWLVIFAVPVVSLLYRSASDSNITFDFNGIIETWISLIPFLIIFVIHNYFIAPFFDKKKGLIKYAVLASLLVFSFGVYRYAEDVSEKRKWERINTEFWQRAQAGRDSFLVAHPEFKPAPPPNEREDSLDRGPFAQGYMGMFGPGNDSTRKDSEFRMDNPDGPGRRGGRGNRMGMGRRGMGFSPMWLFSPVLLQILFVIMLIAANMAVKLFFKSLENEKKVRDLENENLLQQLQYLRYQINPHFFMNTLNNIHALVDIEPSEAKKSLLELSKLMRYVLYEGGKPTIPLDKEVDFLTQYISLMRIRYTDTVKINIDLPSNTSGVEIPPLLFVSFVENAFKHGISYKSESFINVGMEVKDDSLYFWCENSRKETNKDPHSGIGLENVKKRLELLYGTNYTLNIDETEDKYSVKVSVPLQSNVVEQIYQ